MAYDKAAMVRFADYAIANCNGRLVDLAGRTLNVDGRFGYQCMDLWIWIRYRLGFTDNLPTPDAASIWELNTKPALRLWEFWDAIAPDQPTYPGDIGIMNRNFFGNGVGHVFMIIADLGASIRVLELNGLGDGFEDDAGGQHGSPARIHDWTKTHLYGYLRWIGPAPTTSGQSTNITPIQEDDEMALTPTFDEDVRGSLQGITNFTTDARGAIQGLTNQVSGLQSFITDVRGDLANKGAQNAALTSAVQVLATSQGLDAAAVMQAVEKAAKDGVATALSNLTAKVEIGPAT